MDTIILRAKKREELGKKVNVLRKEGLVPAVIYGHKVENKNLTVNAVEFNRVFCRAGRSALVDLEVEKEKPVKVIITDIQRDPVKHNIIHIDFHQTRMDEEITADVALNFVGESPAVKTFGGVLLKNMESIQVRCLPADLPYNFTVDLGKLTEIDSHIAVKDLEVSDKIQVLNNPEEALAVVKAVKVEAEPVVEDETGDENDNDEGDGKREGEDKKEIKGESGKETVSAKKKDGE